MEDEPERKDNTIEVRFASKPQDFVLLERGGQPVVIEWAGTMFRTRVEWDRYKANSIKVFFERQDSDGSWHPATHDAP